MAALLCCLCHCRQNTFFSSSFPKKRMATIYGSRTVLIRIPRRRFIGGRKVQFHPRRPLMSLRYFFPYPLAQFTSISFLPSVTELFYHIPISNEWKCNKGLKAATGLPHDQFLTTASRITRVEFPCRDNYSRFKLIQFCIIP